MLSLWNIHYVEWLPGLDLSSPDRLSFLPVHLVTCFSDRGIRLCEAQADFCQWCVSRLGLSYRSARHLCVCVLTLTEDLVSRLSNAIGTLSKGTDWTQALTKPDEVKAWKHLLPAFTERCRKWAHSANCEYLSKGAPSRKRSFNLRYAAAARVKTLERSPKRRIGRNLRLMLRALRSAYSLRCPSSIAFVGTQ